MGKFGVEGRMLEARRTKPKRMGNNTAFLILNTNIVLSPLCMRYKFITIEGNIGAGKTTLTNILAERLNARKILEGFEDNPFLPKFYEKPDQYAFPLELFFMAERFKQLKEMIAGAGLFQQITLSDYLFLKCLLFSKVNLQEEEYKLYQRIFDIIHQQLIFPDILIYLHAPVDALQRNIRKRNRGYEQNISDEYLLQIQEAYLTYIQQQNLKTIFVDASNADFLNNENHVNAILQALEKEYTPGRHLLTLPK